MIEQQSVFLDDLNVGDPITVAWGEKTVAVASGTYQGIFRQRGAWWLTLQTRLKLPLVIPTRTIRDFERVQEQSKG